MASLFLRSNGIYYGAFWKNGKRVYRSMGCRDREQAKVVFDDMSTEFECWEKITVSLFRLKLKTLLDGNVAPRTVILYDEALKAFERLVGNLRLHSVTAYHIDVFKSARLKEAAPATAARDFRHLKAAFKRAYLYKMIDSNPFVGVKNVRVPEMPPQFLTLAECERLLQVISSPQMKALVIFAASTGMRLGEIVNLRWADVDREAGIVRLNNRDGFTTKDRRNRLVPMNSTVMEILNGLSERSEYVFVGRRGGKVNYAWVSRKFKSYARAAGLSERIHFHSLRHTFASWLVQNNVSIVNVKDILGHSNIATTLIYARPATEQLKESVRSIDGYLKLIK